MRLDLEAGFSRGQRIKGWIVRRVVGTIPGPIVTMSYDPELFGREFARALEDAMRRMKHWSVGEVELFAALVSKENSCAY